MTDEATTHIYAMLDQLIEGNVIIQRNHINSANVYNEALYNIYPYTYNKTVYSHATTTIGTWMIDRYTSLLLLQLFTYNIIVRDGQRIRSRSTLNIFHFDLIFLYCIKFVNTVKSISFLLYTSAAQIHNIIQHTRIMSTYKNCFHI